MNCNGSSESGDRESNHCWFRSKTDADFKLLEAATRASDFSEAQTNLCSCCCCFVVVVVFFFFVARGVKLRPFLQIFPSSFSVYLYPSSLMADKDSLFQGLPPPSSSSAAAAAPAPFPSPPITTGGAERVSSPSRAPILKGVLKREKTSSQSDNAPPAAMEDQQKRLRFKTTVDATETQVIEAMQKITSHIKNPSKFSKASKLALQLIQAGSVKPETADHFFAILEAAMSSPSACTEPSLRADYHALFSAAQDVAD
ncbi:hypothetical protein ACLOJK_024473 [Asimina triloba]